MLAIALEANREIREAEQCYRRLFAGMRLTFGTSHPWTKAALGNFTSYLECCQRSSVAERLKSAFQKRVDNEKRARLDKLDELRRELQVISPRVIEMIRSLLDQMVQSKEKRFRIRVSGEGCLDIDMKVDEEAMQGIFEWIGYCAGEIVGHGPVALHGLIKGRESLEGVACAVLLFDLVRNITLPFGEIPKNTILALMKVGQCFDKSLVCGRFGPMVKDRLVLIKPPFIAHCHEETFLLITGYGESQYEYTELGLKHSVDVLEVIQRVNGFVLAPLENMPDRALWQIVPEPLAAFCWG